MWHTDSVRVIVISLLTKSSSSLRMLIVRRDGYVRLYARAQSARDGNNVQENAGPGGREKLNLQSDFVDAIGIYLSFGVFTN